MIATTLCSSCNELCNTYCNSASVIEELNNRQASILYGIDATRLGRYKHLTQKGPFHLILFHHPHLGLMTSINSQDEQKHHQRHHVLLAHYLDSAKALLMGSSNESNQVGLVHLCLAHDQPQTWKMEEAAHRQGLTLIKSADTCSPFHSIVNELMISKSTSIQSTNHPPKSVLLLDLLPREPQFSAPRRYRNGRLGSKHFLGKYGYQHRRTHGDNFEGKAGDMNVENSQHYFFLIDPTSKGNSRISEREAPDCCCSICGVAFPSQAEYSDHLEVLALPSPSGHKASTSIKTDALNGSKKMELPASRLGVSEGTAVPKEKEITSQPCSWNVKREHNGKRLRRFLQHVAFPKRSKKQCDLLVSGSHIQVNEKVAHDQSRILKAGDVVSALITDDAMGEKLKAIDMSSQPNVPIVASYPRSDDFLGGLLLPTNYLLVANKPAGTRTKGGFESGRTLEELVSWQLKGNYKSLSSIGTGCNGLCVLKLQQAKHDNALALTSVVVNYEFIVLVHGHVPDIWNEGISDDVPWKCVRRWRRQRETIAPYNGDGDTEDADGSVGTEDEKPVGSSERVQSDSVAKGEAWVMRIRCTERTSLKRRAQDDNVAPALCTLHISTACPIPGTQQAIILYLRKKRFPVVGDRLCTKEYASLPRSFRNRIKKKLLMGCFKADVTLLTETDSLHWTASVESPEKFSASSWQQHWENATIFPQGQQASRQK